MGDLVMGSMPLRGFLWLSGFSCCLLYMLFLNTQYNRCPPQYWMGPRNKAALSNVDDLAGLTNLYFKLPLRSHLTPPPGYALCFMEHQMWLQNSRRSSSMCRRTSDSSSLRRLQATSIMGVHAPASLKVGNLISNFHRPFSLLRSKSTPSQASCRSSRSMNLKDGGWRRHLSSPRATLNWMSSLKCVHSRSISRLTYRQIASQDCTTDSPLLACCSSLPRQLTDSETSLSRDSAMGTLMSRAENVVETYWWQTRVMNSPMEEADTAVRLSQRLCGSTCTCNFRACCFLCFMLATLPPYRRAMSCWRTMRSSLAIISRMAWAVRWFLFFLTMSTSRSTCLSYFSRMSSQLLILNSRLRVWLTQQTRLPQARPCPARSKTSWNSRMVAATSSSCASITRLSYLVRRGTRALRLASLLQGSWARKLKRRCSSEVSRSVRLLTYRMACRLSFRSYSSRRMLERMLRRLSMRSSPGMSSTRKRTSCPPTSKDDPSQKATCVVTSRRLLATRMAGLLVSSLVVALLPAPERPSISRLNSKTPSIRNKCHHPTVPPHSTPFILLLLYLQKLLASILFVRMDKENCGPVRSGSSQGRECYNHYMKYLIATNANYFQDKVSLAPRTRPKDTRLKMPCPTGLTVYRKDFKRKRPTRQAAVGHDLSVDCLRSGAGVGLDGQTTYQKEFKFHPVRTDSHRLMKRRVETTAAEDVPRFLETQNRMDFLNWGGKNYVPSMRPSPTPALTHSPFTATSIYRADFEGRTQPPTPPCPRQSSFPKFGSCSMVLQTNYCREFSPKVGSGQIDCKPKYYEAGLCKQFKGSTEYKRQFQQAKQADTTEEQPMELAQLQTLIIDL